MVIEYANRKSSLVKLVLVQHDPTHLRIVQHEAEHSFTWDFLLCYNATAKNQEREREVQGMSLAHVDSRADISDLEVNTAQSGTHH